MAVSAQIGTSINRRFHTFQNGVKIGVANPKDDQHVNLIVHPRYKDNVERYMQVVRSIAMRENAGQLASRLVMLERMLLDPMTSTHAALELEAIGKDSIPVLEKGMKSPDPEIRFYSAEALAYLDYRDAAAPLAEAARDEPAFRAYALAALSAMDHFAAYDALRGLLDLPSNETRYGAFRALWAMNDRDALVRGEKLGEQFNLHVIDSLGPPLVHVTRSYRPEVVLFGQDQRLTTPFVLEAGKDIMLTAKDDRVTVSRFKPNQPDQKRVVSTRLEDCLKAIVDLGGTYPDVVQTLQAAKAKGVLTGRFAIDAVPSGGRRYDRGAGGLAKAEAASDEDSSAATKRDGTSADGDEDESEPAGTAGVVVANPLPGLFDRGQKTLDKDGGADASRKRAAEGEPASGSGEKSSDKGSEDAKKPRSKRSWLGTIK